MFTYTLDDIIFNAPTINSELEERFLKWLRKAPKHIAEALKNQPWQTHNNLYTKVSECNSFRVVVYDKYIRLHYQKTDKC